MTLVMQWLTLWATAAVLGLRAGPPRLLAGSIAAGIIDAGIIAAFFSDLISAGAAIPLAVLSVIPAARVAFGRLSPGRLLLVCAHVLGISVLAFGGALASAYLTGWRLVPTIVGLVGTVLLTAEVGWGLVHRRIRDWLLFVPIEVRLGDVSLRVNALIDTGNRLRDPITGSPVVLLEYDAVADVLPEKVRRAFMAFDAGDFGLVSELLADSMWLSRFRIIPFVSVGEERGLLAGLRADEVRVFGGARSTSSRNAVVGVMMRRVSPEGAFAALLHPDILAEAS
jgi:stage II sporulation protein GA (sporulation sigma-E factor processing peptidase)